MVNPRLASRYAKSLVDLAESKGELATVKAEVDFLLNAIKSSPELKALLRSPIVTGDKKQRVIDAIGKGKLGIMLSTFAKLLIKKGRENVLPEILVAFNEQFNKLNGIQQVILTTASPVSDVLRQQWIDKLKAETSFKEISLTTQVNAELIGGFILEYDNKLVDASIQSELRQIRRQFQDNDYQYNIR